MENDEVKKCEHCDLPLTDKLITVYCDDGEHTFCSECWNKGWRACNVCGSIHHTNDMYDASGRRVCSDCYESIIEDWNECEHCGCTIDPEDDEHVYHDYQGNEYHICPDCHDRDYSVCYECGEVRRWNSYHPIEDDERICDVCIDEHFTRCADCGEYVYNNDVIWSEDDDEYYCDCCYRNNGHDHPNFVRSYHSSPVCYRDFIKNPSWLYLGVEIEMGGAREYEAREAAEYIHENFADRFHMEHDCSIENYGFETISIPLTYTQWIKYRESMNDLYATFDEHGLANDESCGLHIHCSKSYLDSFSWKCIQWFLFKNQDVWEKIAGREESFDFAAYRPRYAHIDDVKNDYMAFFSCNNDARYRALNMTNSRTIEFRLFAAQPDAESFYEKLGIVNYLVRWVKYDKLAPFHMIETPKKAFRMFIDYVQQYDEKLAKALTNYNNGGK